MVRRSIDIAKVVISFMNIASKEYLQDLGVSDRLAIIMFAEKVLGKHNQVKYFQNKVDALPKKATNFKSRFAKFIKKGLPCFWDNNEYLIPQETYHAILS